MHLQMNPVVPEPEGEEITGKWRYKDSFDYPETTGYFSVNDEGIIKVRRFLSVLLPVQLVPNSSVSAQFFALIPKKYSMTFVPQEDGSWVIKDSSAKHEVAHKVRSIAGVRFESSPIKDVCDVCLRRPTILSSLSRPFSERAACPRVPSTSGRPAKTTG